MWSIHRGAQLVGSGATLAEALGALVPEDVQTPIEAGTFVQVSAVAMSRVVADSEADDAETCDYALVVRNCGNELDAVWVYGPDDGVPCPRTISNRTTSFLTDELCRLDAAKCAPARNMPELAGEVVHKDENGRLRPTGLKPATYAAILRAAAAVRDGDAPAERPPGVQEVDNESARCTLVNLMRYVDRYDASKVAYAYNELHGRIGSNCFAGAQP